MGFFLLWEALNIQFIDGQLMHRALLLFMWNQFFDFESVHVHVRLEYILGKVWTSKFWGFISDIYFLDTFHVIWVNFWTNILDNFLNLCLQKTKAVKMILFCASRFCRYTDEKMSQLSTLQAGVHSLIRGNKKLSCSKWLNDLWGDLQ